ncbi:MAG: DUF3472 domain-containing protein [Phycisphaerae bacterium]|nr:DUF3472 domain-containing protein [Phycisphaerae bacterium]
MKMCIMKFTGLSFLLATLCFGTSGDTSQSSFSIPVSGNSWVAQSSNTRNRIITRNGIENWTSGDITIRTFFHVEQTGKIEMALRARVTAGTSQLKCTFGNATRDITLSNTDYETVSIGTFDITQPGYHYLDMQGLAKTGSTYAQVTDIVISGQATSGKVTYVKDDFYFGQRGPSVHLNYVTPDTVKEILYFYNEITIPEGEDVIGSYFMANGFGEGYFGIQVNSPTERRILFSVWSPFSTNNPQEIPEDQRIQLLKKGEPVQAQKFGGEGSGGQSYRKYMWKAGTTYRFLLKGQPVDNNSTDFTAWFFAPEIGQWELMASFRRPKTSTYLRRPHSFLENFIPATGQYARKGLYSNQWICDPQGIWTELTQARFTADATARKGSRLDYAGGSEGDHFFMKNCGFFNERTEMGSTFTRQPTSKKPDIDFSKLP